MQVSDARSFSQPSAPVWPGGAADNDAAPASIDIRRFGPTLVVAPHPDDETLACGGAIALLRRARVPVWVVVISDGAASHPHSRKFPRPRLVALRRTESLSALDRLGVLPPSVDFFMLPDSRVPLAGEPGFDEAVRRLCAVFERFRPRTVLAPWRRDPHRDHRASWELASAAASRAGSRAWRLEYPVWLWASNRASHAPRPGEAVARRLDIAAVLGSKCQAVRMYRSQVSSLIDDDPRGFRLSAAMLAHFERPWEWFFDSTATG